MCYGPEFSARVDLWAFMHEVTLDFAGLASQPTMPSSKASTASSAANVSTRTGSRRWPKARQLIEEWRIDYNVSRPHMVLGNIPPDEYALQAGNQRGSMVLTNAQI